jgi:hypothetical protein
MVTLVREAMGVARNRTGQNKLVITYIGDGGASIGPTKPGHLTPIVRQLVPTTGASFNTVAIGADADTSLLAAMARGGGGVVVPYVPGQKTSVAALSILNAANGISLRSPKLELPPGFIAVSPSELDTIRAGSETMVVARMTQPQVKGEMVLRGTVGGEAFENRYPINVVPTSDAGNAFVPRLFAAQRIAELEQHHGPGVKDGIIQLSKQFAVASRYTSLLVLESEAMFNAFGLDRTRKTPTWTGELLAQVVGTRGTLTPSDDDADDSNKEKGDSLSELSKDKSAPAKKSASPRYMGSPEDPLGHPSGGGMASPPPAATTMARPPSPMPQSRKAGRNSRSLDSVDDFGGGGGFGRRGGWVAMRRIFERKGHVITDLTKFHNDALASITTAENELASKPDSRTATEKLCTLYLSHGQIDKAVSLTERWAARDALDPGALLARADLMARRGNRQEAIRILTGIVDIHPDEKTSQLRLASLYEKAGETGVACDHHISLAEHLSNDVGVVTDAIQCSNTLGMNNIGSSLLSDVPTKDRPRVELALKKPVSTLNKDRILGEVRMTATWNGQHDLDLALIDKSGTRHSWLGGGKEKVFSKDVKSLQTETVGFLNLAAGSYIIEVSRTNGSENQAPITGELTITVAGATRKIPFTITNSRVELGRATVFWTSRLVPM